MEKNWGKSFPESWVWVQALTPDKSVIIAGGPIKLGPLGIVGYVIGYRSGVQKYDFNPQSLSSTHVTHDACKGTLFIQSQNKFEKIVIIVRAPVESFELVMCPTEEGFKLTSEESFVGRMTVYFYKRHTILDSFQIAETSEFQRVGVEYGGSASCVNRKSLSK